MTNLDIKLGDEYDGGGGGEEEEQGGEEEGGFGESTDDKGFQSPLCD